MVSCKLSTVAGFVVMAVCGFVGVASGQTAPTASQPASAAKPASSFDAKTLQACGELSAMRHDTAPDKVYEIFNKFCAAVFGAEKEPLAYDLFGKKLQIVDKSQWVHASETSACIGWETNLPADTVVEYGPTTAYGTSTPAPERRFYIHVDYLKDLKAGMTYHYRLVATDERGNKITSPDATFTTSDGKGVVHIPGDLSGPTYILDKPKTTYVLTKDIVADGLGIEVKAEGITLDLNGHTVTYHDKTAPKETFDDKYMSYVNKGSYGIKNIGFSDFTLVNGTVLEGAGENDGNADSEGFNPLYIRNCSRVKIAGITVNYRSPQNTGMRLRSPQDDVEVHHCVFLDRGCVINSRHATGVRALGFLGEKGKNYSVHHNLVKRTRQMGLLGADIMTDNEVYVDSWSVNSFSMAVWKDSGKAHYNRIFGTGVNVQGFGWTDKNTEIDHNFIHLVGIDTGKNRGVEGWGDQNSLNGLRVTNYDKGGQERNNLLYHDNIVVIQCLNGSQARGTEFFSDNTIKDLICRDTVIKVETMDDKAEQVGCVVTHGQVANADTCLPVVYKNCTLISNICNVRLGDYYGRGSNHNFVECKFVRTGNDPKYHTFIADGTYWTKRNYAIDCDFGPGTAYNDVLWKKTGKQTFYGIKWTLGVKTLPGAKVTIKDKDGATEFEGVADKDGAVSTPLTQCLIRPPTKFKPPTTEKVEETKTPHTVVIEKDGKTMTKTVNMTKKQEITVKE